MPPIFAQPMAGVSSPTPVFLIVAAAATAAVLLMLFSAAASLRMTHRRAEWEHEERMRSLEMGVPLPSRDVPWAKAFVASAIGAGVPAVAFGVTYLAHQRPGTADEIWVAPGVVSALSVISGSILAGHLFHTRAASGRSESAAGLAPKPQADPDAFDVVGRRG